MEDFPELKALAQQEERLQGRPLYCRRSGNAFMLGVRLDAARASALAWEFGNMLLATAVDEVAQRLGQHGDPMPIYHGANGQLP